MMVVGVEIVVIVESPKGLMIAIIGIDTTATSGPCIERPMC